MADVKSVKETQAWVKSVKATGKYTHMVPKNAMATSVIIPLGFATVIGGFLTKGIYNLVTGTGKLD